MAAAVDDLFPCPSGEALEKAFVGKHLGDLQAPAAVLDRAVVERNCRQMLEACQALQIGFRPHVKSHKTIEVTRLQLGDVADEVKLVVSTIAEAEHLSNYLHNLHKEGKSVNILYGFPFPPSHVHRLARLRNEIGPYSVSVLIDNRSQLEIAPVFKQATGVPLQIFIKVDIGDHRAGLDYTTKAFCNLIKDIFVLQNSGSVTLVGFYCHAGRSYEGSSDLDAIQLLTDEIEGLQKAATHAMTFDRGHGDSRPRYILSVGSTPTATSIQNFRYNSGQYVSSDAQELISEAKDLIQRVKAGFTLELHAGVYPFLDMQQLATKTSPSASIQGSASQVGRISTADVALTVMAEVASLYTERERPEALIAAGSLALGREPCKSYNGWGIVSDWGVHSRVNSEGRSGWQVGRISQEHGILIKDSNVDGEPMDLKIGQKVRIWPNHACVAGAGFGWYVIVDSSLPDGRQDEIVDVWVRWRGW